MNGIKYIREKILKVEQAPFAAIAGVSQPTVSRWEDTKIEKSEPTRGQMALIRSECIDKGLPWNDSWFFQTFPDDEPADAKQESAA